MRPHAGGWGWGWRWDPHLVSQIWARHRVSVRTQPRCLPPAWHRGLSGSRRDLRPGSSSLCPWALPLEAPPSSASPSPHVFPGQEPAWPLRTCSGASPRRGLGSAPAAARWLPVKSGERRVSSSRWPRPRLGRRPATSQAGCACRPLVPAPSLCTWRGPGLRGRPLPPRKTLCAVLARSSPEPEAAVGWRGCGP